VAETNQPVSIQPRIAENRIHTKKKSCLHRERDEELRTEFIQKLRQVASERLVWMDETGIEDTLNYAYGYCHKSERFMAEKLGHRTQRVSVIAGWREGECLAPMVFEGYTNSELVCRWAEEMLLTEMLPGQILVLDNASFHPKQRLREILGRAGCEVMFLPPYSSDLNRVEKFWARVKLKVGQWLEDGMTLLDAVMHSLVVPS